MFVEAISAQLHDFHHSDYATAGPAATGEEDL